MAAARPKLYVIPASWPCAAVEAALALKSIAYDRVELMPMSQLLVGPALYGGTTVPAMRIGGERIVGSRPIMRRLDELEPEPPLLPPADSDSRAKVLEAERWGEQSLQSLGRRLLNVAFVCRPLAIESYLEGTRLPLPPAALVRPTLPAIARVLRFRNKARDEAARATSLPADLDRIDAWIAEGVLGGEQPNAADLQIGSTIGLLMNLGDIRPLIEGRPAAALTRYLPPAVGEVQAGTLPAEWRPAAAGA